MPKLFAIALLMFFTLPVFSQSKLSNEIVAEGSAKTMVKPDLALFVLTVEKTDTTEKTAISQLNKTVDALTHSLALLGFKNENIKVASYDISSSTNREDHKKMYTASNVLKVNFKIDNKLIDAFYTEIQQADIADLDISFETSLSDSLEKASRLQLVRQAIDDAKMNATNIALALSVHITKVKQVHKYADEVIANKVEMVKFIPPIIKRDTEIKFNTPFEKFQVEEVELEERITIVYEIGN